MGSAAESASDHSCLVTFSPWERMMWVKLKEINKDFVAVVFQVSGTEGPGLLLLPDLHGQEGQGRSSHHPAAPRVVLHQQRPEVCRGEFISFFISQLQLKLSREIGDILVWLVWSLLVFFTVFPSYLTAAHIFTLCWAKSQITKWFQ